MKSMSKRCATDMYIDDVAASWTETESTAIIFMVWSIRET